MQKESSPHTHGLRAESVIQHHDTNSSSSPDLKVRNTDESAKQKYKSSVYEIDNENAAETQTQRWVTKVLRYITVRSRSVVPQSQSEH